MTTLADGNKLAAEIRASVRERALELSGPAPKLVAVLVGENPASEIYVRNKARDAEKSGLRSEVLRLPASTPQSGHTGRASRVKSAPR